MGRLERTRMDLEAAPSKPNDVRKSPLLTESWDPLMQHRIVAHKEGR